jgi:hypothetical protein
MASTYPPESENSHIVADLACAALRFSLLDEVRGLEQTVSELTGDVVRSVQPPLEPEFVSEFGGFMTAHFDGYAATMRAEAALRGVDLVEFASALQHARAFATEMAHRAPAEYSETQPVPGESARETLTILGRLFGRRRG